MGTTRRHPLAGLPCAPRWSGEDDATLARLYGAGRSKAEIACQIDRTEAAVATRIARLGIARRPRPRTWLKREEQALIRMRAVERLTVQQIADRLRRTKRAVSQRIVRLGLSRQKRQRGELSRRVVYWHGRGLNDSEIAERLFLRSSTAVRNVRVRLGLPPNITPSERGRQAGLASHAARRTRRHREAQSCPA